MCSGIGISLAAAACHVATAEIVKKYRPPESKGYLLFLTFYFVMEGFQALQWWLGDVRVGCTPVNKFFTVIAYALIWIQPLLYVLIGKTTKLHALIVRLTYPEVISKILFIYSMVLLFVGFGKAPTYLVPNSNFGLETCTTVGKYGHLAWQFAPISVSYSPTHIVYLSLIAGIIAMYPPWLMVTIGLGWIGSLFIALLVVGPGAEIPAVWCQLSILVDLPIILRSITHKQ